MINVLPESGTVQIGLELDLSDASHRRPLAALERAGCYDVARQQVTGGTGEMLRVLVGRYLGVAPWAGEMPVEGPRQMRKVSSGDSFNGGVYGFATWRKPKGAMPEGEEGSE